MAAQLRALGVEFEEIDVDSEPRLRVQYGRDVPVLVTENSVYKHRLTPEDVAKLR
jgi:hypothetical protein